MKSKNDFLEYIIVTSDEPWGDIWHTQLHYAYQLSKRFQVIYVDPPRPWKISNLFDFKPEIKEVSGNLNVFRYKNVVPSFLGRVAVIFNDFINEHLIRKQINGLSRQSELVVWHFDPFRSHFIFRKYPRCKHIFHVVDPIVGFHMNEEMTLRADLVIVTSPKQLSFYQE